MIDLKGRIERITYTNEENGYTVARIKVYGRQDLVTAVGNLSTPTPGEVISMKGEWMNHPRFGEQFKIQYYSTKVPATVYGIRKYLGSGLIKGVGPVIAERIASKFGEKTLDIIESEPDRLTEVDGIGAKRIRMIRKAWDDQKEIRSVMLFLQSHGVSAAYAVKIYKTYGKDAIAMIRDNPYRMAMDIFGIGFVTADKIAEKLGFAKDSPERARAGILYTLHNLADEGHVFFPYDGLIEKSMEILQVERNIIASAIADMALDKRIVIEDLNDDVENYRPNHKAVYLAKYFLCETRIAQRLKALVQSKRSLREANAEKALEWVQQRLGINLDGNQVEAIQCALKSKVMVVTGGPGVGKTTIITGIIEIFKGLKANINLGAPTGRAAKRMAETTGQEAKTIHRLLSYNLQKGGFSRNEKSPLQCDLLVIDEASMIDTVLMHHLLKAVPLNAVLILVGDVNQLPSVGPGNVLEDIISSGIAPVVKLTKIFRQAEKSRIVVNAHRIVQGMMPLFSEDREESDFYFIQRETPEEVLDTILKLVSERIPERFGLNSVQDIQVLTPMNRGVTGTGNLNIALRDRLNPAAGDSPAGVRGFRVKDKIMQIRNNYEKEVYNGDIGGISAIDAELREITVTFDSRRIVYDFSELDELAPAYAVSVHKSQGSEYPAVVIPVTTQHYILLQRNLIYTAVTRGKRLTVLVGTKKALAMAVKNDKTRKRYSRLCTRLCE